MDLNLDLLKRIAEAPGIPGHEDVVRAIVVEVMRPLVDELSVDALGNVIGRRGSGSPRVMLAAHMDEIGFIVRNVDERGAIWLQPVGWFDARNLIAQRVIVHGRGGELRGALNARRESPVDTSETKPDRVNDIFIDVGLTPEEAQQAVEIGDVVTLDRTFERVGNTVMSKSLDDRVSVFIMLEMLRMLGDHDCEVVAVATVQEEVGLRGAATAAFRVEPDIGIALDVCPAATLTDDNVNAITQFGSGPGIKLMDMSVITNRKLQRAFRDVAERHEIPYQLEVMPFGGTDAGAIDRSRAGVRSITISVPTRYAHTVNEMVSVSDIEQTIELLAHFLREAHQLDLGVDR